MFNGWSNGWWCLILFNDAVQCIWRSHILAVFLRYDIIPWKLGRWFLEGATWISPSLWLSAQCWKHMISGLLMIQVPWIPYCFGGVSCNETPHLPKYLWIFVDEIHAIPSHLPAHFGPPWVDPCSRQPQRRNNDGRLRSWRRRPGDLKIPENHQGRWAMYLVDPCGWLLVSSGFHFLISNV